MQLRGQFSKLASKQVLVEGEASGMSSVRSVCMCSGRDATIAWASLSNGVRVLPVSNAYASDALRIICTHRGASFRNGVMAEWTEAGIPGIKALLVAMRGMWGQVWQPIDAARGVKKPVAGVRDVGSNRVAGMRDMGSKAQSQWLK